MSNEHLTDDERVRQVMEQYVDDEFGAMPVSLRLTRETRSGLRMNNE